MRYWCNLSNRLYVHDTVLIIVIIHAHLGDVQCDIYAVDSVLAKKTSVIFLISHAPFQVLSCS